MRKSIDLLKFWYVQRIKGFDAPGDEPFMDPDGAARFKQELARATRYAEFGSGGTTVQADKIGVDAVSVENDRFYARAVATRLQGGRVRQIVIDTGLGREWGFPLFPDPNRAWNYVSAAFAEGPFPDFILVDGRYRVACALESARQAVRRKSSALLMLDDYAGRPQYRSIEDYLGQPEMAGRTAIFRIGHRAVPRSAVELAVTDPR